MSLGRRGFPKPDDRRSPSAAFRRGVEEGLDQGVVGQKRPDDRPLGSRPPAVNQTYLAKAAASALGQVLAHDVGDVSRGEGVQVEAVLDRQNYRLLERTRKILLLIRIGPARRHRGGGQPASGGR